MLRIGASYARHVIEKETKKIRQQMRSKRGRQARARKTQGQRKEQWMHQVGNTRAYEKEDKEDRPPWTTQDTPDQRRINTAHKSYIQDAQKAIEEKGVEKWKKRWLLRRVQCNTTFLKIDWVGVIVDLKDNTTLK